MSGRDEGELTRRLERWLAAIGLPAASVQPLAGDVSSRRYYRVADPVRGRLVAAHYPAELADAQRRFARAAALLERAGVRVPAIVAESSADGFSLLEDLGPRTLYEEPGLDWEGRRPYFHDALDAARKIAQLPREVVTELGSPPLDAERLRRELDLTVRLFLAPHGIAPEPFVAALGALCDRLGEEPLLPCHRDLMARNVVPVGPGRVALIDFQDLRLGPACYDLASMLNDSLFAPEPIEREMLACYLPALGGAESYGRAVAQRALKAVGSFVAFAARGEPRHLPLVAPTLARAERHLRVLPETRDEFAPLAQGFAAARVAAAVC